MPEDLPNPNPTPSTPTMESATIGQSPQTLTTSVNETWVKDQIATAKKEVREDTDKAIREQVQTDKASLITVFGIFASVISFLTIEFQFLKTLCSFEKILGFTLILFALLFGFNVALDYLVKSRLDKQTPKPNLYFVLMIVFIFISGIYFTFQGNEEICVDNKIYQRYSKQFEANVSEQQKEMDNLLKNFDSRINYLESIIQNIKTK